MSWSDKLPFRMMYQTNNQAKRSEYVAYYANLECQRYNSGVEAAAEAVERYMEIPNQPLPEQMQNDHNAFYGYSQVDDDIEIGTEMAVESSDQEPIDLTTSIIVVDSPEKVSNNSREDCFVKLASNMPNDAQSDRIYCSIRNGQIVQHNTLSSPENSTMPSNDSMEVEPPISIHSDDEDLIINDANPENATDSGSLCRCSENFVCIVNRLLDVMPIVHEEQRMHMNAITTTLDATEGINK